MNLQEFKTWVRRQLGEDEGCPSVKVELSDKQIEQALNNAKEWFEAFVGLYKEASFALVSGKSEYDLSGVSPTVGNVVKAWFPLPANRIDFNGLYSGFLDIDGIPYGCGGTMASGAWGDNSFPQTTVVQAIQTMGANERLFSSDLDWEFYLDSTVEPHIRVMRVMPPPVDALGNCIYLYSIDPSAIKLEWYTAKHLYWLKQWALADAKYILGRKRGKFKSLPTAGGERSLDGEDLISESKEEKERLEEKILDVQGPVLPMIY